MTIKPRAMTIKVTGKNLDVGDALRGYVQERVVHTVEKFIGREPTGHGDAINPSILRPVLPQVIKSLPSSLVAQRGTLRSCVSQAALNSSQHSAG